MVLNMSLSVYRSRANECITMILCMKDVLPIELIQAIIIYYWSLNSTPVLITQNISCTVSYEDFKRPWYSSGEKDNSVLSTVRQKYPDIRHFDIVRPDLVTSVACEYEYNNYSVINKCPKGLRFYTSWSSMIILVPGPLWDAASLNIDADVEIIDGVQVFNGYIKDRKLHEHQWHPYDMDDVQDYIRWLDTSICNKEFMTQQNALLS